MQNIQSFPFSKMQLIPRIRTLMLAACLLLCISLVNGSGEEHRSIGRPKARDFALYLSPVFNELPKKYGVPSVPEDEDEKLNISAVSIMSSQHLMKSSIYIYRRVIGKFIDAYHKYQRLKKIDEKTKKDAGLKFGAVVQLYMEPLIAFSNKFEMEKDVLLQMEDIVEHENTKGKWNTVKSLVSGTMKVAVVALAVMSLNLPEIAGAGTEISKAITDWLKDTKDADEMIENTFLGRAYKKAKEITTKGFTRRKDIVVSEIFTILIEQTKALKDYYYDVIMFQGLTDEQKKAAATLRHALHWLKAPEDETAKQLHKQSKELEYIKTTQASLLKYISMLQENLETHKIVTGSQRKNIEAVRADAVDSAAKYGYNKKKGNYTSSLSVTSENRPGRRLSSKKLIDLLKAASSP